LGRQRFSRPARIRLRLRMTHVDWPIERQWQFVEHGAIKPLTTVLPPEDGTRNSLLRLPVPVIVAPECPRLIPSSLDELQIPLVGDFVLIDFKSSDLDSVGNEFVIPAEGFRIARKPESYRTSRDTDHSSDQRRSTRGGWIGFWDFFIKTATMQQVRQSVEVHERAAQCGL